MLSITQLVKTLQHAGIGVETPNSPFIYQLHEEIGKL
jgi:hypothetical protein